MVIQEIKYRCDLCACEEQDDVYGLKYERDFFEKTSSLFLVKREESEQHICIHCIHDIKDDNFMSKQRKEKFPFQIDTACYSCGAPLKGGETTFCDKCNTEYAPWLQKIDYILDLNKKTEEKNEPRDN